MVLFLSGADFSNVTTVTAGGVKTIYVWVSQWLGIFWRLRGLRRVKMKAREWARERKWVKERERESERTKVSESEWESENWESEPFQWVCAVARLSINSLANPTYFSLSLSLTQSLALSLTQSLVLTIFASFDKTKFIHPVVSCLVLVKLVVVLTEKLEKATKSKLILLCQTFLDYWGNRELLLWWAFWVFICKVNVLIVSRLL